MPARRPITIRREQLYPDPPEHVWVAVTDPHALAEWFEPNDHQPVVGHRFRFMVDPGRSGIAVKECEVLEADLPRRLVWRWQYLPDDPRRRPDPMQMTWTLVPEAGGTRLVLEHAGAENVKWLQRTLMGFGWGYMMKKLIPRILANVQDGRFTPGAIPLSKRFYKCETVPEQYVR